MIDGLRVDVSRMNGCEPYFLWIASFLRWAKSRVKLFGMEDVGKFRLAVALRTTLRFETWVLKVDASFVFEIGVAIRRDINKPHVSRLASTRRGSHER